MQIFTEITDADYPAPPSELDILRVRVGEMAAEIERLQSVIDEANAQKPIYQAQSVGGLWSDVTAENYAMHETWRIAYARPIPAQQSPHGLTFEDYEEVLAGHRKLVLELDILLNGDGAAKQASLCDVVGQVAKIVREKGEPQPAQAAAIPEWKPIDDAPIEKDILVVCDNFGEKGKGVHFAVVRWDSEYGVFADANIDRDDDYDLDVDGAYHYATHWMPLPAAPKP